MNPVRGAPPELEWIPTKQLLIDQSYQRSIEAETSRRLIAAIANDWDWTLCAPLSVSRRADGSLYVMDGQHRREAALLRGDIERLPCVITAHDGASSEAGFFVTLNRKRRALSAVDVWKANVAAGDEIAVKVATLISETGLSVAPHGNFNAWKPGMLFCVSTIQSAYKLHGREIVSNALVAIGEAFEGQILRYGGTLFKALVLLYANRPPSDPDAFIERLAANSQEQWIRKANMRISTTGQQQYKALFDVLADI